MISRLLKEIKQLCETVCIGNHYEKCMSPAFYAFYKKSLFFLKQKAKMYLLRRDFKIIVVQCAMGVWPIMTRHFLSYNEVLIQGLGCQKMVMLLL